MNKFYSLTDSNCFIRMQNREWKVPKEWILPTKRLKKPNVDVASVGRQHGSRCSLSEEENRRRDGDDYGRGVCVVSEWNVNSRSLHGREARAATERSSRKKGSEKGARKNDDSLHYKPPSNRILLPVGCTEIAITNYGTKVPTDWIAEPSFFSHFSLSVGCCCIDSAFVSGCPFSQSVQCQRRHHCFCVFRRHEHRRATSSCRVPGTKRTR